MQVPGLPLWIDTFSNSHSLSKSCPSGLAFHVVSHFHSDHLHGLHPSWNDGIIFCSEVTRALLLLVYELPPWRVIALPTGETFRFPVGRLPANSKQSLLSIVTQTVEQRKRQLFRDDDAVLPSNLANNNNSHAVVSEQDPEDPTVADSAKPVVDVITTTTTTTTHNINPALVPDGVSCFSLTLLPAAHIPGSVMIAVDYDPPIPGGWVGRVLYTGDFRIDGTVWSRALPHEQAALDDLMRFFLKGGSGKPVDVLYTDTTWLHLKDRKAFHSLLNLQELRLVFKTIVCTVRQYQQQQQQQQQQNNSHADDEEEGDAPDANNAQHGADRPLVDDDDVTRDPSTTSSASQQDHQQQQTTTTTAAHDGNDNGNDDAISEKVSVDDQQQLHDGDCTAETEQEDQGQSHDDDGDDGDFFVFGSPPPYMIKVYMHNHFGKEVLIQDLAKQLDTTIAVDARRYRLLSAAAEAQRFQKQSLPYWEAPLDMDCFVCCDRGVRTEAGVMSDLARHGGLTPCIQIVRSRDEVSVAALTECENISGIPHFGLLLTGWSAISSKQNQSNNDALGDSGNNNGSTLCEESRRARVWSIPFSLHSSREDLELFVKALSPQSVYPLKGAQAVLARGDGTSSFSVNAVNFAAGAGSSSSSSGGGNFTGANSRSVLFIEKHLSPYLRNPGVNRMLPSFGGGGSSEDSMMGGGGGGGADRGSSGAGESSPINRSTTPNSLDPILVLSSGVTASGRPDQSWGPAAIIRTKQMSSTSFGFRMRSVSPEQENNEENDNTIIESETATCGGPEVPPQPNHEAKMMESTEEAQTKANDVASPPKELSLSAAAWMFDYVDVI